MMVLAKTNKQNKQIQVDVPIQASCITNNTQAITTTNTTREKERERATQQDLQI
jgi:hypothetical protein